MDCPQIFREPIEAAVPEVPVVRQPIVCGLECCGIEVAWAKLSILASRDEASALQDLEVLGNGREANVVGLGQFFDGCVAGGKPCQNVASRSGGQREEDVA